MKKALMVCRAYLQVKSDTRLFDNKSGWNFVNTFSSESAVLKYFFFENDLSHNNSNFSSPGLTTGTHKHAYLWWSIRLHDTLQSASVNRT